MLDKINSYLSKGYLFAILSNQGGIEAGQITQKQFTDKVDELFKVDFNFPGIVLACKTKNYYRKPCIGMLEMLKEIINNGKEFDLKNSYYIGDGAGRKKDKGYSFNDFTDSDLKFALNCGLNFMIPEHFFEDKPNKFPDLSEEIKKLHLYDNNNNNHIKLDSKESEIILLIGPPGSGKSSFCEGILKKFDYVRINQDTLKTRKKVIDTLNKNLIDKKKVVIDSTNGIKEKRKEFIEIAKKYKVKIRAFWIDIPKEFSFHLNNLREININKNNYSAPVNKIVIHSYYKYFNEPTKDENFDEIVKVNFVPNFKNENEKKVFYYLS